MENENYGIEIANNIRAERNRAKLSQEKVADMLEISTKTYINYESNAEAIKATTIYKLSKMFNCNIDDFFVHIISTNRE